ncbi:hypothetical protein BGW36DRAFT_424432 [Talaromyces proteolyticus]|uniref:Uncharacterized protein n=1 Tax=Talaromyces proteolyticus TaxID=1131652 RepID=A0AAD4KXM4_9EURO|nr:uncharacterized protein BGW36DRAFT_424432 [Talaromyces proteolyticus]KAH8702145.1 hypothetical protein BGW36DRAFT_424432 [Talaromyces proteolyticus]
MALDQAGGGVPTENMSGRAPGLDAQGLDRSTNPPASIDDYNRVMLQYTQQQLAAFTNNGDFGDRRSSATSGSSGHSNSSSVTNMASAGNGPPPRRSGSGRSSKDKRT